MKFTIVNQGEPAVNDITVCHKNDGFVAFELDMSSKYCKTSGSCSGDDSAPVLYLSADENSLHLHEGAEKGSETWGEFPEYEGWSVWSATCSRYTARVCLSKDQIISKTFKESK